MSIHRFISLVLHENKWLLNEKEQVRIFLLYWSRVQLCDYIRFCTSCYIRLRRSEEEKDDGFYQSYAHWFDMNTLILHSYHHLITIQSILILHFAFFLVTVCQCHFAVRTSMIGHEKGHKRKKVLDDDMKLLQNFDIELCFHRFYMKI